MSNDVPMPDAFATEVVSYPHFILPGEILSTVLDQSLKLGPGLRQLSTSSEGTAIKATQAGLLHRTANQREFYIDYNSHRVPSNSTGISNK